MTLRCGLRHKKTCLTDVFDPALDEKSDLRMPQTQFKHLEPPKFIRVSIHLQLIRENLPCICTYENIMV